MTNLALKLEPAETALTFIQDGKVLTDSRTVAATFGKEHRNVIAAIKRLDIPADFNALNFKPVEYTDEKGERRPCYHITRDGFVLLVMGFTGKKAMAFKIKYIEAFNAMERALAAPVPALDAKAIGGIVKKCAAKAVKDEIANVRPAPFQVATAYEKYAFEDTVKRLVRETLVDFFASKDNFPHPSGMAIKKCASGDLLKTLNLLSERIDNMGRNMTRGFPSAWERSVVRYATDAAQAVGAPAYVQTYVTKAEYVLLCSVRGVDIPLMTA